MKKAMVVGLLAFAVALSGTAYAEVQNIKVGGDVDLKFISHHNYDLKDKQLNNPGGGVVQSAANVVTNDDDADFFLSTVRVKMDADLTDNVSTHVKLLNQRIWGTDTHSSSIDTNAVLLNNAYVVLKEFLYSPLTIIAGRQDLQYGNGFIVGPGLLKDPEGIFTSINTGSQTLVGREFSANNSYDAIRVILDFSPITVEGLYAKITASGVSTDDQTLYGLILNYKLDRWNAEIEPYYFFKDDQNAALSLPDSIGTSAYDRNEVHTVGARAGLSPIQNLVLSLEGAYQFGNLTEKQLLLNRTRRAQAADVDIHYNCATTRWTPIVGAGWVYYSGEQGIDPSNVQGNQQQVDRLNAWDQMYRGQFHTYIQDFLNGSYGGGLYATVSTNDTSATTNRHLIYGDLGFHPMQDVTLWGRFTHVLFAHAPVIGRSGHAGDEVDAKASYAYTEDVNLAVAGGWFIPGKYYRKAESNTRSDALAWTLVGSANVKF